MGYNDNSAKRLWNSLIPAIKKLIRSDTDNCVRRIPGEVVDADNNTHYATVRLATAPTGNDQNMVLMNCSGQNLKTGDSVWIEYVYSMDNAYIAIRNNGRPWGW